MKQFGLWNILVPATLILIYSWAGVALGIDRAEMDQTRVSVTIEEGAVVDILKLLAMQNNFNLSVSSQVEDFVTISLTDVSLTDALDVITSAVAASWYIAGSVVVVKPLGQMDLREFETKIIRLQHIPADAAKTIITPVIPQGGAVEVLSRRGESSSRGWDEFIEIRTYAAAMEEAERLIEQIDVERPMVEIEVRIIETTVRDESKLGLDFPENYSVRFGDLDDDELELEGLVTRSFETGSVTWGRMTAQDVTLYLDLLIRNGNSKLISNPRVTTLSNQEAEIEVSTTIPVETLNRFSEAGVVQDIVSFQDLDVSIKLKVTPRVSDDSTITLDVASVVEEIAGYTGPADNQRPITSRRSVTSSVTIKSGESLGLGGLMKEVEHKTISKIPILGSIPVIGRIFQHHSTTTEKTDLTILITPRILGES